MIDHTPDIGLAQILQIADMMLRAVGTRALSFTALAMTFGLFCWAMFRSTPLAFWTAGAFCIGVLWPVLICGYLWRKSNENPQ